MQTLKKLPCEPFANGPMFRQVSTGVVGHISKASITHCFCASFPLPFDGSQHCDVSPQVYPREPIPEERACPISHAERFHPFGCQIKNRAFADERFRLGRMCQHLVRNFFQGCTHDIHGSGLACRHHLIEHRLQSPLYRIVRVPIVIVVVGNRAQDRDRWRACLRTCATMLVAIVP